jgi:hypothetical protein
MGDPAKRLRRKDEPGRGKKLKAKSGKRKAEGGGKRGKWKMKNGKRKMMNQSGGNRCGRLR